MDQLPAENKFDDLKFTVTHIIDFYQYPTNPAFYYISAGLARSFSHGDVSMVLVWMCFIF